MDGSLDHVFANGAALGDVTGVDIWNINADESVAFEYSRTNYNATDFYQPNQFRASDHDPEIIGIDVPGFPADTTVSATSSPTPYGTRGSVDVSVSSVNQVTGTVTLLDGDTTLGTADVAQDGTATVSYDGTALEPGSHDLTVRYSGDDANRPSSGTVTVEVTKATATVNAVATPDRVLVKDGTTVTVTVGAAGYQPGGTVVFSLDGQQVGERVLSDGTASLDLGPFKKTGSHTVTVSYSGDVHTESGDATTGFEVVKKSAK